MSTFQFSFLFFSTLVLSGCATIINGSTEKVKVWSSVANTKVYANDVYIGLSGPDQTLEVTVPKRGGVVFVGKKDNCSDTSTPLSRTYDATTLLGILIDMGLFSILVVDVFGTGAYMHSSQPAYFLDLNCRT